jgi:uncharacterized protein YcnI
VFLDREIPIMQSRKRLARRAAVLLVVLGSIVATTSAAWAHVTVRPRAAEKGSFDILTFSVPNESDTASTTRLEVTIPTDRPIANVSIQPKPGWSYTVERSPLEEPVGETTEVISKITWSGSEIKPGEFDLFSISVGPLPTKGKELLFPALQVYSDGTEVNWNERQAPGGEEPEHPAPVLKLTKPPKSSGGGGH